MAIIATYLPDDVRANKAKHLKSPHCLMKEFEALDTQYNKEQVDIHHCCLSCPYIYQLDDNNTRVCPKCGTDRFRVVSSQVPKTCIIKLDVIQQLTEFFRGNNMNLV